MNIQYMDAFTMDHRTTEFFLNYSGDKAFNSNLAGQIKNEIQVENAPDFVIRDILTKLDTPKLSSYSSGISILTENAPYTLHNLWINKQKKHEYNPVHTHSGLFSFVFFAQIPYDLKEEEKVFPRGTVDTVSRLSFLYTTANGRIEQLRVPVDKSFVGKMIMFDAQTPHCVYPFYTSDDYRITVSGNIRLKVNG